MSVNISLYLILERPTLCCFQSTESKWSLINQLNTARRSLGNVIALISCHVLRSLLVCPSYIMKQLLSRLHRQIINRHAYLVSQEASLYNICQSAIDSSYFSTVRKVSWVWNTINTTSQAQHSHREIRSALVLLTTQQPTNACCTHALVFYPNS